jgi:hypothetical protein|tara:strand:+ start:210 stop:491 length:282 start_codon:yes stop_codon:yes gene_type:complete
MCNFNEFVKENSAFILTFTGILGSCCTGVLVFLLRSRCTKIACCGFSCERNVIPASQLTNVTIERDPPQEPTRGASSSPVLRTSSVGGGGRSP